MNNEWLMPARVAESTIEGITPEIARLLPERGGFGLSGPVGSGKTGAVAALMLELQRKYPQNRAESYHPATGITRPPRYLAWCSWPETVNGLRVLSMRDRGLEDAAEIVERLATARWLVLDDLGAERIKGDYAADWATTQLDLIVDERYNAMLPTWYTTSLTRSEFSDRYGRRMVDRLASGNPLIEVPEIESRRLG